jgi:putative ABC transport system permease protein
MNPNLPLVTAQTLDHSIAFGLSPQRVAASVAGSLGIVALVLTAIGIYGVTAYAVTRRTREIGIRIALGARPAAVVGLVLRQGLGTALAGVAVGAVLAAGAAKAMAGALYGVSFIDPLAWTSSIALLVSVSALANIVPARRASIVDPTQALRSE